MKIYIAAKPCTFGDQRYVIGEKIPAEYVDPNRVNTLVKIGVIQVVEEPDQAEPEEITPEDLNTPDNSDSSDEDSSDEDKPENADNAEEPKKTGRKSKQGKKVE